MKKLRAGLLAAGMACPGALSAQSSAPHKERRQDIVRHKEWLERLRQDCKGFGIGKYCGMRHKH